MDVRVIAATNRNLQEMVQAGTFREDLYYRLNVIHIPLPPLRERREDIPLLVRHFLDKYEVGGEVKSIGMETLRLLENYPWPGNIRELENVIERAVVLEEGHTIGIEDLPAHLIENVEWAGLKCSTPMDKPYREAKQLFMEQFDKAYGGFMLERAQGNVTMAASLAGMDRSNFRKVLRRADLIPTEFKEEEKLGSE